jgi:hypothetical protein
LTGYEWTSGKLGIMTAVQQAKENVIATARAKPEAGSNPEKHTD